MVYNSSCSRKQTLYLCLHSHANTTVEISKFLIYENNFQEKSCLQTQIVLVENITKNKILIDLSILFEIRPNNNFTIIFIYKTYYQDLSRKIFSACFRKKVFILHYDLNRFFFFKFALLCSLFKEKWIETNFYRFR